MTVNAPDGFGYLASGSFRAVTIADYTFIVNTKKVCKVDDTVDTSVLDPSYYRWINKTTSGADFGFGDITTVLAAVVAGKPYQYQANHGVGTYMGALPAMETQIGIEWCRANGYKKV